MDHKQMDVWKKSMDLVEKIYKLSEEFPKEEVYGLTSQIRRASISIPSNIAEGVSRKSDKETLQFMSISLGSVSEVETQYLLAVRLGFITESKDVKDLITLVRKLIIGTRNYIRKKEMNSWQVTIHHSQIALR